MLWLELTLDFVILCAQGGVLWQLHKIRME